MDTCLLCGSHPVEHIAFEDHNENDLELPYLQCPRCGLVFQSRPPSDRELEDYYRGSYRKSVQGQEEPSCKDKWVQEARAKSIVTFLRAHLPQVSRHLDIGSSSGDLLLETSSAFGCVSVGVEPSDAYRDHSISRGTRVFASLEEIDPITNGKFDLITMSHVLEHLPSPRSYIIELRKRWLTDRGALCVEVPNLFGHPALEASHLTAYAPNTLIAMLDAAGYKTQVMITHGQPYSRLLRMFITTIAVPALTFMDYEPQNPHLNWMRVRRKMGLSLLYGARAVSSRLLRKGQLEPWGRGGSQ